VIQVGGSVRTGAAWAGMGSFPIPAQSKGNTGSVATEPNRTTPNRTRLGFGSISLRSVRFDDNPNREIQDRFDSAVRDLRFDSIRFEYPRLEPNQLSNRFDSVDSVYYCTPCRFILQWRCPTPRFVTDFHAFRVSKTSKFRYILV
jgi:hypothetical protein